MSYIESNYAEVTATEYDFAGGAKPAGITETTTTGSSIAYTTAEGGRATLSSGSGSSDEAAIKTAEWDPTNYDALSLSTTIDLTSAAAGGNNVILLVGLYDSDDSDYFSHILNHGTNNRGTIELGGANGSVQVDTRGVLKSGRVTIDVLWDRQEDLGIHRTQDTIAQTADASGLATGSTYGGKIAIIPKDTTSSIDMHVHEITMAAWRQKR